MSVFKSIRHAFAERSIPTLRYDKNGIHRSWRYDADNTDELAAIKALADYATAHKIPQHKLNVWTENNRIYYNIRHFLHGWTFDRFTHYMTYPSAVRDAPRNEDNKYWSLKFSQATDLDPDKHFTCAFYHTGTCRFCNGPNETP